MEKIKSNKIINFIMDKLSSLVKYLDKNKFVIALFFIIFMLLFFQHNVVGMYFDDYGNASLSYSYWVQDVVGTNYTIPQLLEWAGHIYNNWGGRILYAIVFIIPLLRNGIKLYMYTQTIVITLIIFAIYLIVKHYSKKGSEFVPIILLILYTCIHMAYLHHGIYWASASVLYVWPLLPLLLFMYLYMRSCDKIKKNKKINYFILIPILCVLNFFATFSQEQIGIGLFAFIVFYIIFHHLKSFKKYLKIDIISLVVNVVSYIVLFAAPGNWVRMDSNEEFAKLSFIEKIIHNFPEILKSIFFDNMQIFIFIICILMFYMGYKVIKEASLKKRYNIFIGILLVINVFQIVLMKRLIYSQILYDANSILWLISAFIISLFYFNYKKRIEIVAITVAAVASIFCLLLSPVVGGRTCIPFIFLLFVIITIVLSDIISDSSKCIKLCGIIVICVLGLMGAKNYFTIYRGYRDNYPIMKLNDSILRKNYGNKEIENVTLYKVENSYFGSMQSYEQPSMDFWIKEYYNIPQSVKFEWIDIYN